MLGDLLVVGKCPELLEAELDRVVHPAVDAKPVVREAGLLESTVFAALGEVPVVAEER